MDVIINNPAATQLPAQVAPTFQGYGSPYPVPGYGYGYGPQHHGPGGFFGGLLLLLGAFLIARFALRRAWMRRGWAGRPDMARRAEGEGGPQSGSTSGPRWPFWGGAGEDEALRIARERFARSEISAEEYEAIRKGLQDQS